MLRKKVNEKVELWSGAGPCSSWKGFGFYTEKDGEPLEGFYGIGVTRSDFHLQRLTLAVVWRIARRGQSKP